jgi:pimeloyl-ACP methyl ester carboxylesterase
VPDIRYARSGGVAVAYQVVGEGPQELVFVPVLSSVISLWELPALRTFLDRLSAETRLTILNPRGMGQSDRPRNVTLEDWAEDIVAVLDAESVERASLFGASDSANACVLTAATYPERVRRLILHSPFALTNTPSARPRKICSRSSAASARAGAIAPSSSTSRDRSTPSGRETTTISIGSSGTTGSRRARHRLPSTGECRSARTSRTSWVPCVSPR